MIGLTAIASALPKTVLTASGYGDRVGLDEATVIANTGIRARHFLEDGEGELPLAEAAFRSLQSRTRFSDGEIDLIIYVTQNPCRSMPHSAAQLLGAMRFKGCPASFDISLGCSGYPYALSIASGLMEAQKWDKAVIITNDPYSGLTTLDDPKTSAIFGDGATATLVERDAGGAIKAGDFGTDGDVWDVIYTPRNRDGHEPSHILDDKPVNADAAHALRMNGTKLARYFGKTVPVSIERCLEANAICPEQVDLLVLHQASRVMLDLLKRRLPFGAVTDVPIYLAECGNTGSSSIPITLEQAMTASVFSARRVLLCGFGVGLSWGSVLLDFGKSS